MAKLVGEGIDVSQIESIEQHVVMSLDNVIHWVERTCEELKAEVAKLSVGDARQDRKIFVHLLGKMEGYQYFKLTMQQYSGVEPQYKEFFKKNLLSTYDLRQLNMVDTVGDTEDA